MRGRFGGVSEGGYGFGVFFWGPVRWCVRGCCCCALLACLRSLPSTSARTFSSFSARATNTNIYFHTSVFHERYLASTIQRQRVLATRPHSKLMAETGLRNFFVRIYMHLRHCGRRCMLLELCFWPFFGFLHIFLQ